MADLVGTNPKGLLRPATWKYFFWSAAGWGYLYGMAQRLAFTAGTLPAFQEEEEKKLRAQYEAQLAKKDAIIAGYVALEPKPEVESSGEAPFHFRDLESDELLNKWVDVINTDASDYNLDVNEAAFQG
eukprot:TRINITY_DN12952_c0_g1_i1.p1 TRINITY_DN12952_c0_g1~~TRINITY_DN12952_c0_g1_i1.p1  ORF type:complete len:128 (-),score=37.14 TRINITY_DN12952_c0_g1_i1:301-684(-)